MDPIEVELTPDQVEQLKPLSQIVDEAYMNDEPGAILAQVLPHQNIMYCYFIEHADVIKMYKALGKELPSNCMAAKCTCAPGQGGPCSFCMEAKYNI